MGEELSDKSVSDDDFKVSVEPEWSDMQDTEGQGKKGIIYMSSIPKYMNVTRLREIMQQFGEVKRIFLQPAAIESTKKKKKPAKRFTEGWIEFEKKRVAKQVAVNLNNKQIGGRKKSKYYDCIWNIKYLSRFKWVHLCERLAYERAVRKQRMRAEIAQVKKEATNFSLRIDQYEKLRTLPADKLKHLESKSNSQYPQRKTEDEFINKKKYKKHQEPRTDFLKSLFS